MAPVILSFLGGIRWGTAVAPFASDRQAMEFATSVIPSSGGFRGRLHAGDSGARPADFGFLMQALWK